MSRQFLIIFFLTISLINTSLFKAWANSNAAGLPIPRFVSLRSAEANLRVGPGHHFPAEWTYERARFPVEVIAEFGDWRKIRDYEGTQGWFHRSLLSGRRYIIVLKNKLPLKKGGDHDSKTISILQNGIIAELLKCNKSWCHVYIQSSPSVKGWVERAHVWGISESE